LRRIVILHPELPENPPKDEWDVIEQVHAVSEALGEMGYDFVAVPFSLDLKEVRARISAWNPSLVFNLVESVEGQGRFLSLAPALLDSMDIPYTGATTDALYLTSNKVLAKRTLMAGGLNTPGFFTVEELRRDGVEVTGRYIIKSIWEHASVGLDQHSVVRSRDAAGLLEEMDRRRNGLGKACFAESYIEGREFNVSLLGCPEGPEVLPPAEIHFMDYSSHQLHIVDYRAKWESDSFEFQHTPRSFRFPPEDKPLLETLKQMSLACWNLFRLNGCARVDFRVDLSGTPWILEVNANPCLAPDAGFTAATIQHGLSFREVVERILTDLHS